MSRIANYPIAIPDQVELKIKGRTVSAKGRNGEMEYTVHALVDVVQEGDYLKVAPIESSREAKMLSGTMRVILNNLITGVSTGFERKLEVIGVGYRAQVNGRTLTLALGFSHPIQFEIPEGVVIETPSQTEILVKGMDKQKVGQVAADIRGYRPPEPYKGKGTRYVGEHIVRKEAKKS